MSMIYAGSVTGWDGRDSKFRLPVDVNQARVGYVLISCDQRQIHNFSRRCNDGVKRVVKGVGVRLGRDFNRKGGDVEPWLCDEMLGPIAIAFLKRNTSDLEKHGD